MRINVRNFGPFEEVGLELKPLTVIMGKNTTGKSMLARLVWALMLSAPNIDILRKEVGETSLAEKILEGIEMGRTPVKEFKELVNYGLKVLPELIARKTEMVLDDVFNAKPEEFIHKGAKEAVISMNTRNVNVNIVLDKNGARVTMRYPRVIDDIGIELVASRKVKVTYKGETVYYGVVASIGDVNSMVVSTIYPIVIEPFWSSVPAFLPDERIAFPKSVEFLRRNYPYEEFMKLYYKLVNAFYRKEINIEIAKTLLNDLGCRFEIVGSGRSHEILVETWTGKKVILPYAPSGIRKAGSVVLALTGKREPRLVIIEEPELHLHPRAQKLLVRLITRVVNELGKHVMITTHSDYIVYVLNNLIVFSKNPRRARELGYSETEVLKPDNVAVYLVRAKGRKAVVEQLKVNEKGIPEDEFTRITEELGGEKSRILSVHV